MTLTRQIGALRWTLAALVVALALSAPVAYDGIVYSGWKIIPTLIASALAPIVFMGLLLDMLMTRVWMADASGDETALARLRRIMWFNLLLLVVLVGAWAPFFLKLTGLVQP